MRRLALLGLLIALPLVAVPLVWAATSGGGSRGGTLSDFRDVSRLATAKPAIRPIESLQATPRRISFVSSAPGGVAVEVRDVQGTVVRRLGHFTVSAQTLTLTWDERDDAGRRLRPGRYVAVVSGTGELGGASERDSFDLRRLRDADDADRQSLREPGNA